MRHDIRSFLAGLVMALTCLQANAQTFNSGSDGSDGPLELTTPGIVAFFDLALDADRDSVYHFTTITIAEGVTVDMARTTHAPVTWLATGEVQIDGVIDLNGEDGHPLDASARPSLPGAGGYSGGAGGRSVGIMSQAGGGPGGGESGQGGNRFGGGAGHAIRGLDSVRGGPAYGNIFLLPLLGGSGGGGSGTESEDGSGGGAGDGALLIASSVSIALNGAIQADGGQGGALAFGNIQGGGGSGGSIRLIGPIIRGTGSLSVRGGNSPVVGMHGSHGRIRLEAFLRNFTGETLPAGTFATPGLITLPEDAPLVRVTHVDGVEVPANPSGGFFPADVVINRAGPTTFDIAARSIPLGTLVTLTLLPETGDRITVDSTPLEGTLEASTATATANVPHGFTSVLVEANWEP